AHRLAHGDHVPVGEVGGGELAGADAAACVAAGHSADHHVVEVVRARRQDLGVDAANGHHLRVGEVEVVGAGGVDRLRVRNHRRGDGDALARVGGGERVVNHVHVVVHLPDVGERV